MQDDSRTPEQMYQEMSAEVAESPALEPEPEVQLSLLPVPPEPVVPPEAPLAPPGEPAENSVVEPVECGENFTDADGNTRICRLVPDHASGHAGDLIS